MRPGRLAVDRKYFSQRDQLDQIQSTINSILAAEGRTEEPKQQEQPIQKKTPKVILSKPEKNDGFKLVTKSDLKFKHSQVKGWDEDSSGDEETGKHAQMRKVLEEAQKKE